MTMREHGGQESQKEYALLIEMPPAYQVAGQVLFTDKAINEGLASVEESRQISLNYEDLCAQPQRFFHELKSKFTQLGFPLGEYNLEQNFPSGNKNYTQNEQSIALEAAYAELQEQFNTLK